FVCRIGSGGESSPHPAGRSIERRITEVCSTEINGQKFTRCWLRILSGRQPLPLAFSGASSCSSSCLEPDRDWKKESPLISVIPLPTVCFYGRRERRKPMPDLKWGAIST